jgi:hypothetical protein
MRVIPGIGAGPSHPEAGSIEDIHFANAAMRRNRFDLGLNVAAIGGAGLNLSCTFVVCLVLAQTLLYVARAASSRLVTVAC